MRLRKGDPTETEVRWFFVEDDAEVMPYPTRYASLNWDGGGRGDNSVGEICAAERTYDLGGNKDGYQGKNFCGPADYWVNGAPVDAPNLELASSGFPKCCLPLAAKPTATLVLRSKYLPKWGIAPHLKLVLRCRAGTQYTNSSRAKLLLRSRISVESSATVRSRILLRSVVSTFSPARVAGRLQLRSQVATVTESSQIFAPLIVRSGAHTVACSDPYIARLLMRFFVGDGGPHPNDPVGRLVLRCYVETEGEPIPIPDP